MTRTKAPANGNDKEKRGRGRPSDYRDDHPERVYKLALLGFTDTDMAKVFGISEVTFNAWKKTHPEFLKSIKKGKDAADGKVAESLYHRGRGYSHPEDKIFISKDGEPIIVPTTKHYPPDTAAAIYWLNNRQRSHWSNKHLVEHSGPDGGPISIAHKIDLSDLTDEELQVAKKMGLANGGS